jgi:hypothetical protein
MSNKVLIHGHWIDDPDTFHTVVVSLDKWNGVEDEEDGSIFYYTDGDQINVGDVIAGDFRVNAIHGWQA